MPNTLLFKNFSYTKHISQLNIGVQSFEEAESSSSDGDLDAGSMMIFKSDTQNSKPEIGDVAEQEESTFSSKDITIDSKSKAAQFSKSLYSRVSVPKSSLQRQILLQSMVNMMAQKTKPEEVKRFQPVIIVRSVLRASRYYYEK